MGSTPITHTDSTGFIFLTDLDFFDVFSLFLNKHNVVFHVTLDPLPHYVILQSPQITIELNITFR